jgi:hypothetical protein
MNVNKQIMCSWMYESYQSLEYIVIPSYKVTTLQLWAAATE